MPTGTKPTVTSQTQSGKKIITTDFIVTGTEICHWYCHYWYPRALVLLDCHLQQRAPLMFALLCIIGSPFRASSRAPIWRGAKHMCTS